MCDRENTHSLTGLMFGNSKFNPANECVNVSASTTVNSVRAAQIKVILFVSYRDQEQERDK